MTHHTSSIASDCTLTHSSYRGWESLLLDNGLISLQVVPEVGGRIMQFKLGGHEYLWVNPRLAGQLPPPSGLGSDGSWLNFGGEKIWPAPQGWSNDAEWPGPPGAVLDGQPHSLEELPGKERALRLTSGNDPLTGIRFSRVVRLVPGTTRVSFEATMTNIDTKPRRWGIWSVAQIDAGNPDGGYNKLLSAWCPLNPKSHFDRGYNVIFGAKDNPSFQRGVLSGQMCARYQYKVGKIGLDSNAGWAATVNGQNGDVFVQQFAFDPGTPYPDGSSVEFWMNGTGEFHAYGKDITMPDDSAENPYVMESEIVGPFAALEPGESSTWRYGWAATNIGGDFPVVDCAECGVISEALTALVELSLEAWVGGNKASTVPPCELRGRFGAFMEGSARVNFLDAQGIQIGGADLPGHVSPLQPLIIAASLQVPAHTATVDLVLINSAGQLAGRLATAPLITRPARWSREKAQAWYDGQPWLMGCNFLPSTAVNDVEMWMEETFDPATIDLELGLAGDIGLNSVRVFLNFVVWQADPGGLKKRIDDFLAIAAKRGISVMVVLLDDCNFADRVAKAEPQPAPLPGIANSQWVSSPPLAMVNDPAAWLDLERYVKDIVGSFGQDPRVIVWDIYNEPCNTAMVGKSRLLLEKAFAWAREVRPMQPLTACAWIDHECPVSQFIMGLSDIVSFHSYFAPEGFRRNIAICRKLGRPLLCTEWLDRGNGNTVEDILPMLHEGRIASYHWGLVNGRTQTHLSWASRPGMPEPARWQHDLFRADGTIYSADEIRLFKNVIARPV